MPPRTDPEVAAWLRARDKKLKGDLRQARARWKKYGKEVSRDLSASFSKVRGALASIAGVGGLVAFAAVGRDVLDFERKLERLRIASGTTKDRFAGFRDEIRRTSDATGQSRQAIADAATEYVKLTGDLASARAGMDLFARVATATGASITDVARAATDLRGKFKIEPSGFERAFDVLIAQGNAGAIEISDLASQLVRIAPLATQFGKAMGQSGLTELGAIWQAVRTGSASADDATVLMQNLMGGINRVARLRKISLFTTDETTGKKRKKSFRELLDDMRRLEKSGKKKTSVDEIFRDKQMRLAFIAYRDNVEMVERLASAQGTAGTTAKQLAQYQASSAGRIEAAWARIHNQLTALLTPERVEKFADAVEGLVKALAWAIDNAAELAIVFGAAKIGSWAMDLSAAAKGADGLAASLGGIAGKLGGIVALTAGLVAIERMLIKHAEAKQEQQLQQAMGWAGVQQHGKMMRGSGGRAASHAGGAALSLLTGLQASGHLAGGKLAGDTRAITGSEFAGTDVFENRARRAALEREVARAMPLATQAIGQRGEQIVVKITADAERLIAAAEVKRGKKKARTRARNP